MWGKCLDCPSCPQKSYHLTPKYLNYAFWDRFAMSPKYPILFFPSLSKPSCCWCCSVVKSCLTLGDPRDCGMPGSLFLIIFQSLPKFMFNELLIPSNHLILCHPLLFLPSILPSIRVFSSSHQVAKVLELHLQHQSFQRAPRADILEDWLISSPCFPRDSRVSSPGPRFESINSSVLCLLYGPTLTSTHDHWKDHSLDYMDLCWQSGIFAF